MTSTSQPKPQSKKATLDKLREAEKELQEYLERKKHVDRKLTDIEVKIYRMEENYVEATSHTGNVIQGFDNYLNTRSEKKRVKTSDSQRIFTKSSTTAYKAIETIEDDDSSLGERSRSVTPQHLKSIQRTYKKKKYMVETPKNPKKIRFSLSKDTEEELDI
ncbi:Chromatin modification- protein meaf6 [Basidiobolus ranarum]|uniref:Chromatin modification-related protein EAF6 n=1 Tax=Basidiobolus ranarum TaxID=34480 RepID=A0ABR2VZX5_9FUNG